MGGCASCHCGNSSRVAPPPVAFGDHKVSHNQTPNGTTAGGGAVSTNGASQGGSRPRGTSNGKSPNPSKLGGGVALANGDHTTATDPEHPLKRGDTTSMNHQRGVSTGDDAMALGFSPHGSSSHLVHRGDGATGGNTLGVSVPASAFVTPSVSPAPDSVRQHTRMLVQQAGLRTPPEARRPLLPAFEDTPDTRYEFFKRTVFAARLTSDELRSFADLFKLERHTPDTVIYRQGQYSETFFIIWQGQVDIQVDKSRPLSAGIKRDKSRVFKRATMEPGTMMTSPPTSPTKDTRHGQTDSSGGTTATPGTSAFATANANNKDSKDGTVAGPPRRRRSGGGMERQTNARRRHRQGSMDFGDSLDIGGGSNGSSEGLAALTRALANKRSHSNASQGNVNVTPPHAAAKNHSGTFGTGGNVIGNHHIPPPPTAPPGTASTSSSMPPRPLTGLQLTPSLSATPGGALSSTAAAPLTSLSTLSGPVSPHTQHSHLISPHGGLAAGFAAAAAASTGGTSSAAPTSRDAHSHRYSGERKRRVSDSKEEKSTTNHKPHSSGSEVGSGSGHPSRMRTASQDSSAGVVMPSGDGKKAVVRQLFGDDKAALMLGVDGGKGKSKLSHLATKQPGEFFGVSALFSERRHTSMATAATHCSLLTLQREDFLDFKEANPGCASLILDAVGESIESCLQRVAFFQGMSPAKLSLLSSLFKYKTLEAGATLFEEGSTAGSEGNSLFFLYEGSVGVVVNDPSLPAGRKVLKELGKDRFFGEVGLIIDLPRTATIVARERCLLLELVQDSFRNFVQLAPEVLANFKEKIEDYHINPRYLLSNKIILEYFVKACEKEFSTENIEFYQIAQQFKQNPEEDPAKMLVRAQEIVDQFVSNSALKQVNLKAKCQHDILDKVKQGKVDRFIFDSAEEEILALMNSDSFRRFKASPAFRQCLELMNSPYQAIHNGNSSSNHLPGAVPSLPSLAPAAQARRDLLATIGGRHKRAHSGGSSGTTSRAPSGDATIRTGRASLPRHTDLFALANGIASLNAHGTSSNNNLANLSSRRPSITNTSRVSVTQGTGSADVRETADGTFVVMAPGGGANPTSSSSSHHAHGHGHHAPHTTLPPPPTTAAAGFKAFNSIAANDEVESRGSGSSPTPVRKSTRPAPLPDPHHHTVAADEITPRTPPNKMVSTTTTTATGSPPRLPTIHPDPNNATTTSTTGGAATAVSTPTIEPLPPAATAANQDPVSPPDGKSLVTASSSLLAGPSSRSALFPGLPAGHPPMEHSSSAGATTHGHTHVHAHGPHVHHHHGRDHHGHAHVPIVGLGHHHSSPAVPLPSVSSPGGTLSSPHGHLPELRPRNLPSLTGTSSPGSSGLSSRRESMAQAIATGAALGLPVGSPVMESVASAPSAVHRSDTQQHDGVHSPMGSARGPATSTTAPSASASINGGLGVSWTVPALVTTISGNTTSGGGLLTPTPTGGAITTTAATTGVENLLSPNTLASRRLGGHTKTSSMGGRDAAALLLASPLHAGNLPPVHARLASPGGANGTNNTLAGNSPSGAMPNRRASYSGFPKGVLSPLSPATTLVNRARFSPNRASGKVPLAATVAVNAAAAVAAASTTASSATTETTTAVTSGSAASTSSSSSSLPSQTSSLSVSTLSTTPVGINHLLQQSPSPQPPSQPQQPSQNDPSLAVSVGTPASVARPFSAGLHSQRHSQNPPAPSSAAGTPTSFDHEFTFATSPMGTPQMSPSSTVMPHSTTTITATSNGNVGSPALGAHNPPMGMTAFVSSTTHTTTTTTTIYTASPVLTSTSHHSPHISDDMTASTSSNSNGIVPVMAPIALSINYPAGVPLNLSINPSTASSFAVSVSGPVSPLQSTGGTSLTTTNGNGSASGTTTPAIPTTHSFTSKLSSSGSVSPRPHTLPPLPSLPSSPSLHAANPNNHPNTNSGHATPHNTTNNSGINNNGLSSGTRLPLKFSGNFSAIPSRTPSPAPHVATRDPITITSSSHNNNNNNDAYASLASTTTSTRIVGSGIEGVPASEVIINHDTPEPA